MPQLQAAVFLPCMKDLPPPGLDLFDLDEQFASERIKMAQLTNKCNDDEIEYFVKECGDITDIDWFMDKETQKFKGAAICTFASAEAAAAAVLMEGTDVQGRPLRTRAWEEKEKKAPMVSLLSAHYPLSPSVAAAAASSS